jgi:hypothetical protein
LPDCFDGTPAQTGAGFMESVEAAVRGFFWEMVRTTAARVLA